MLMQYTIFKHLFLFGALAFIVSSCSCSDRECKSSRDCSAGEICRSGKCVNTQVSTPTDSTTNDSGSATATDTASSSASSSDSDSGSAGTDSASDSDTALEVCIENWECIDDSVCTIDVCQDGHCTHSRTSPLPTGCCAADVDCNDEDSCTTDTCNTTTFSCVFTDVVDGNCCTIHEDCDDSNDCTRDACGVDGQCVHVADLTSSAVPGCCDDVNDCGDSRCASLACIDYKCVTTFPAEPATGCCAVDSDCSPGEGACTVASCNSVGECEYETNPALSPGCCATAADCDDGNSCNVDSCNFEYQCIHSAPISPAPGCCLNDGDCADGDNCTADLCLDYVCTTGIPNPLPVGCCNDENDCDDFNDCTREVCNDGHCYSAGDPSLGTECCFDIGDCDDSNGCTQDSCSTFTSACRHDPPDTDNLPAECCLVAADCVDTDPCTIGICSADPQFTCQKTPAVDNTPCDNDSWCDGPEICISGVCQTQTDGIPCGGPAGPCREVDCVEPATAGDIGSCTVIAEYDTDSACDDGVYCNGDDVCLAGDCVHQNPPCEGMDTDSLDICQTYTCNEASTSCEVGNKPDFTSCDNNLQCDGVNTCMNGTCVAGSYCGAGNDCLSYDCIEDTGGGPPSCVENPEPNGKSCTTPDLGACYGSTGRMCLNGTCSMGDNPLCEITAATNGFCTHLQCVEAWDTEGCFTSTVDPADTSADTDIGISTTPFDALGCATPGDTASGDYANTAVFTTALQHSRVSDYGGCGNGFTGGDLIYQIELEATKTYTFALSDIEATLDTSANAVSIMLLTDACDAAASCAVADATPSASINYTPVSTGTFYIVIDTIGRQYASGTLTVTCP